MADAAEHFKHLRDRYRGVFCGNDGQPHVAGAEVLANLRTMTKYGSSPFSSDAITMAYHVGMQDVFRHIQQMLNIPDAEIYRLTQSGTQEKSFYDD